MVITSLKQQFQDVVQEIHKLPGENEAPFKPPVSLKLQFYSLYKQATEGPCKDQAPPIYNFVARTKWSAWNRLGDMGQEEAMRAYVKLYRDVQAKHNPMANA